MQLIYTNHLSLISLLPLLILPFLPHLSSSAALIPRDDPAKPNDDIVPFPFSEEQIPAIENVFSELESVPSDILSDDSKLNSYIQAHFKDSKGLNSRSSSPDSDPISTDSDGDAEPLLEPRAPLWYLISKCAFEIGKAIAENVFPAAKLRRIVELVKFLGGARKVAKMLVKAKSLRELLVIGGPELQELAEILLGVSDVAGACFTLL